VVVAEEEGDDSWRGGGEKGLLDPDRGERRLEALGVDLRGPRVAHADRAVAGRRPAPGPSGVAEDALRQLGEVHQVLVLERLARAAEPGQAVLHVGRVARLAELAVVDHVDAGLGLLPHHLRHTGADARGEGGAVDRHAFLPSEHRANQVVRPREAARVRGEEPVGAALHAKRGSAAGTGAWGRPCSRRTRFAPRVMATHLSVANIAG
jgi:hypothetical protein